MELVRSKRNGYFWFSQKTGACFHSQCVWMVELLFLSLSCLLSAFLCVCLSIVLSLLGCSLSTLSVWKPKLGTLIWNIAKLTYLLSFPPPWYKGERSRCISEDGLGSPVFSICRRKANASVNATDLGPDLHGHRVLPLSLGAAPVLPLNYSLFCP